jgi:hypothetical protein
MGTTPPTRVSLATPMVAITPLHAPQVPCPDGVDESVDVLLMLMQPGERLPDITSRSAA